MVVFFFEHATRLKVYVAGDVEVLRNRKEKVLYLSNHQSTVDWVCCNLLAIRQGSLGHLRYVMKNTLQKLPLYGFYFYQHGCIYVKRGGFSQVKMERALQHLAHRNVKASYSSFRKLKHLVLVPKTRSSNPVIFYSHKRLVDQKVLFILLKKGNYFMLCV